MSSLILKRQGTDTTAGGSKRRNWMRVTVLIVNLGLCVLIALASWRIFNIMRGSELAQLQVPPVSFQRATTPDIDIQRIASAHLFGKIVDETKPQKLQYVPETALALVLSGVAVVPTSRLSQAIIAVQGDPPQPYSVGDSISGNAIVHGIHQRYIVIRRGTQYETLWLERYRPKEGERRLIPITPAPQKQSHLATNKRSKTQQRQLKLSPTETKKLKIARSAVLTGSKPVSAYVRLQAIHDDGGLRGYRVYPGNDPSLFNLLGFERGDLVTGVNKIVIGDVESFSKVLSVLNKSDQIILTIIQGGQQKSIQIGLSS